MNPVESCLKKYDFSGRSIKQLKKLNTLFESGKEQKDSTMRKDDDALSDDIATRTYK